MNSIGTIIKKSRKEKNISIDLISKELKISKEIITNLENDKIVNNSDIVYYIGHLRTYLNFLELDTNNLIKEFKTNMSFKENININKISKPLFTNYKVNVQKYISGGLIVTIFATFYFLFDYEEKKVSDYALIPDLPESYVPIIEKSDLNAVNNLRESDKKNIKNNQFNINSSSVIASDKIRDNEFSGLVTLKLLNSTWVQIRDKEDKILLSKLMEKDEEFSYDLKLSYNITTGNAGNIMVLIDNEVRGKIGKYGEILDSYILDNNFKN